MGNTRVFSNKTPNPRDNPIPKPHKEIFSLIFDILSGA